MEDIVYLHNGECLDSSRVGDVWTRTQVDERTTAVDRRTSSIWDLVLDKMDFVLAVFEHLQQRILIQFQSLERLFLLNCRIGNLLQWLVVF